MFEKLHGSFISVNKIKLKGHNSIIPDSIFEIGNEDNSRYLLFEMHNGKDSKRIIDQIEQHAIALTGLYTHKKYNIPSNKYYYILIVFEETTTMEKVLSTLKNSIRYQNIARFFLCKHILEIEDNLLSNWVNLKCVKTEIEF